MQLESVMQSEIGQTEKNKYEHICVESRKMAQMNLFVGWEQT